MAPDHNDDGTMPRVTASIPTNQKVALDYLADARSRPGDREYVSGLVREAIEMYIQNVDDLPEEAKDALDDDLVANAGGSKEGADA